MKLPRQCRSQTRLSTPVFLKRLQDAPLRHPASLARCRLRPNTDKKFCQSSTVKFASCAVHRVSGRYRGMKLLTALLSIALSGSARGTKPAVPAMLRAPRHGRRTAQGTCISCERDSHGGPAARGAWQAVETWAGNASGSGNPPPPRVSNPVKGTGGPRRMVAEDRNSSARENERMLKVLFDSSNC
jgi:hypothetical protein